MKLNGHSMKPEPTFFGKGEFFLGLELEMEAGTAENRDKGLNLLKDPSYCYAKSDGSLRDYGWELITHPMSDSLWLGKRKRNSVAASFFSYVENLRKIGYTSHSNARCGLHIHVSLSAFGITETESVDSNARRRPHLYWFMRLVNSDLFKRISQRCDSQLNDWTKLVGVRTDSFHTIGSSNGDRYVTTNVTRHTVEVRVFRGNMREDRVRKCIESIIAAVRFTKALNVAYYIACQKDELLLTNDFLKFIDSNAESYVNLYKYLVEIGQLGHKEAEAR